MESPGHVRSTDACPIELRLLGALEVRRGGVAVPLPASRKVRALLAYLALAPRAVSRSQLCELLWDVPDDPRGELRWCLSKLRRLLDAPVRTRVLAEEDALRLDLAGCRVDALEVRAGTRLGAGALDVGRAEALSESIGGDLLEGLEMDPALGFTAWLASQRRSFRAVRVALLERLSTATAGEAALAHLERWLELAPFDRRAHELLLGALARSGRIPEGEEHLAAVARRFEEEGLDAAPVRRAWDEARREMGPSTGPALDSTPSTRPDATGSPDAAAPSPAEERAGRGAPARRASVAVLPFEDGTGAGGQGGWARALAHDVITRLAKLRSLFVIAEGTAFALEDRRLPPEAAGRVLDVDYVVVGRVALREGWLSVDVQLDETRTARVVWSETFEEERDGAFDVLEEIGNRVVASVAGEIEANERNRAVLKPPGSLDAWEAHHLGLWHMYRFTRADNEVAQRLFLRAVALDPTFSRAHAGLSFTHWQSAFQGWGAREAEAGLALEAAGRGMLADDRDPAVHWAQGRALWLGGLHGRAVQELELAVDLSPNFAQGHYSLAFVQAQAGDPGAAIEAADRSRSLSPFDPLLFGMLGARAMALVRLGRLPEAAESATKAAARPNAHAHIFALAAFTLALAGALDEARIHAGAARRLLPGYGLAHFLGAFRFDREGEARFAEGARRVGVG